MKSTRQGAQKSGLSQSRYALEQHMTGGQQADQHAFDNIVLTDNDFGDLPPDCVEPLDG